MRFYSRSSKWLGKQFGSSVGDVIRIWAVWISKPRTLQHHWPYAVTAGPFWKFLHKRGLLHFCEGILGKQWIKITINTCRLNTFPDCNITFVSNTTGMTATSFTDESRNEAQTFVFAKATFLNSATADKQNHIFLEVSLYDLDSEKIRKKNTWTKPLNDQLHIYILLDVTCMVQIVHFPSRCWPCRLTTFEADATTDVAEDASAQVADTVTVSSCLDQFVYRPWKVWWKISWLLNSFQHFFRVIMLQF